MKNRQDLIDRLQLKLDTLKASRQTIRDDEDYKRVIEEFEKWQTILSDAYGRES